MNKSKIDKVLLIVPILAILLVCVCLILNPESSYTAIATLRNLVGDKLSSYYLILGLLFVGILIFLSFSKYGKIRLGDKVEHSTFSWGAMIFTSTMAADIVYFSFHEWSYYFRGNPIGLDSVGLVENQAWAATYPLFHWGPTPWAFYIVPAIAYAYMMYVRKKNVHRISDACDVKNKVLRSVMDIFAIIALLAATSTTFSLATPLMSEILCEVLGLGQNTALLTVAILFLIAIVYTVAVIFDIKGISKMASLCVYLFFALLIIILCNSNIQYTIETGLTGIGKVLNNFISLSTETGSLRLASDTGTTFTQDYTIFYWAYWISWALATPFFIARISKGRTIRQVAIGAMIAGLLGTYASFIVFGNFGLYQQVSGKFDFMANINIGMTYPNTIVRLLKTLPWSKVIMLLVFTSMTAFYASTFDALTLVVSQYTCKEYTETPSRSIRVLWCVVLILLPIALIFTGGTLESLQSLSIIAALPLSLIFLRVIYVFFKHLRKSTK